METKEKINIVLSAAKKGKKDRHFTRTRIDPKGKGSNIRKLERGEIISEQKLDEMCSYILQTEGKKNPFVIAEERISIEEDRQIRSNIDSQPIEQKIKELEAKISNLDKKLDQYQELEAKVKSLGSLITNLAKKLDNDRDLESKFKELESSLSNLGKKLDKNKILEMRIKALEVALSNLDKPLAKRKEKVLGFSLVQKKIISGEKEYQKWYAYKQIEGKLRWIYIGNDKSKAKDKINQWLEKNQKENNLSILDKN